jgi:uncharacterized protein YggL (DUF469 family)
MGKLLAQHFGSAIFAVTEQYDEGIDQRKQRFDAFANGIVVAQGVAYEGKPAYTHSPDDCASICMESTLF